MIKNIIIGLSLLVLIATIGFIVFSFNFKIFDEPTETQLKVECDQKGLRKIRMTKLSGNATVEESIHIYASSCGEKVTDSDESIFIATSSSFGKNEVSFEWKSIDTVIISYNKNLSVFKKKTESEFVVPKVFFKYIAE